jgi:hypothetical protein
MTSRRSEKGLHPERARCLADDAEAMTARDPRRIAASIAMFERLAQHWTLRADEREMLLGGIAKSTWSEWRQHVCSARIKSDTRERIANLFTIDLNAHSLFAPEFADRWVREPNAAFAGESPMSAMLRGKVEDVITVRRYLERIRSASPNEAASAAGAGAAHDIAVSYMPGDALESNERYSMLHHLRFVVAAYERLASKDSRKYRAPLASALNALATSLSERNDEGAVTVLQRAIEIERHMIAEQPAHKVELLRSLFQLADLLRKNGDEHAAGAALVEAHHLLGDTASFASFDKA